MLILQHYLLTLCALSLSFKRPPTCTYLYHSSVADSSRFPHAYLSFLSFMLLCTVSCYTSSILHFLKSRIQTDKTLLYNGCRKPTPNASQRINHPHETRRAQI